MLQNIVLPLGRHAAGDGTLNVGGNFAGGYLKLQLSRDGIRWEDLRADGGVGGELVGAGTLRFQVAADTFLRVVITNPGAHTRLHLTGSAAPAGITAEPTGALRTMNTPPGRLTRL